MTGCVRIVLVVLLVFRISSGQRDLISNNPSSSPWKPIRKDDVGETTYANDVTTKNNLSDNGLETSSEGPRPKRGVIHLYNMLSCATGCNPLIYKGYGCYCGFLGSGRPVDGIDSCCKRHDWCYNNSNCPFFLEYFVPYHWKCHSGRPLCGIQRGHSEAKNSCSFRLCECDRIFSECLKRFPCPSRRAICRSSAWRLVQNKIMFFTLF